MTKESQTNQKGRPFTDHPYSFAASRRCTRDPIFGYACCTTCSFNHAPFYPIFNAPRWQLCPFPINDMPLLSFETPELIQHSNLPEPSSRRIKPINSHARAWCSTHSQTPAKHERVRDRFAGQQADGQALGCNVQPPRARVARLGIPAGPIPGPLPGMHPLTSLPATLLRAGTCAIMCLKQSSELE
jgi:hypothetical protein